MAGEESIGFVVCCGHPGASLPSPALTTYTLPSCAPTTIPIDPSGRVTGAGEDCTTAAGRARCQTSVGAAKAGAAAAAGTGRYPAAATTRAATRTTMAAAARAERPRGWGETDMSILIPPLSRVDTTRSVSRAG